MRIGLFFLLALVLPSVGAAGTAGREENGLLASLEPGRAAVGGLSEIRWRLSERKTGKPVPARLTLTITHLEKERRVFFLEGIPTDGGFSLRFHFTDGAAYRISSLGWVEGRGAIEAEREVNVTGRAPPREAVYPSLFLFLAVIALGLAAGRFTRRKAR